MDDNTAPYVREAYRRVAGGESIRRVAAWVAALPEPARGGRNLDYSSVRGMLSAPLYVSRPYEGDSDVLSRPVGHWPALLDDMTWARVQTRIASHAHTPHQATGRYLLTGLIRCPHCGARMTAERDARWSPRYKCDGGIRGADAPDRNCYWWVATPFVDTPTLDTVGALIEAITAADPGGQTALHRAWQELQAPADTTAAETQRRHLEHVAQQARKRLTDAALMLVDKQIDRAGYDRLCASEQAALDAAEAELEHLRPTPSATVLPSLDVLVGDMGGWAATLASADVGAQRELLATLIEYVAPIRLRRGDVRVETTWTPLGQALGRLVAALGAHQPAA
jgi:hypothetical protein